MSKLLYLVHRLPYPPDKGDKVRSYHLLKHLSERHQVFLGTFIDDPQDEVHLARVRSMCAGLHVAHLDPSIARIRSLGALLTDEPLSLRYYRDAGLRHWVMQTAAEHHFSASVVFSSVMVQYAQVVNRVPMLVDFVDVDSAKWSDYGVSHRWPLGGLYKREGRQLLAYERKVAALSRRSFFVTENEVELFVRLAPECTAVVESMGNGVDTAYFSPDPTLASPYPKNLTTVVFTGAMDYWPNVDAMRWFVNGVWPHLASGWPQLRLCIVGRNPGAAVQALSSPNVIVTGTVSDVRPYLQHAAVVVAPLRLARGIQNKVLEAMAMGRPVVISKACATAIEARAGTEVCVAAQAEDFVRTIDRLLRAPEQANAIGAAARRRVLGDYSWRARLSRIDQYLTVDEPCEVS